jgi:Na+/H+-dicarboxylate symporter
VAPHVAGLLPTVDLVTDMFLTAANVTADMLIVALLDRRDAGERLA